MGQGHQRSTASPPSPTLTEGSRAQDDDQSQIGNLAIQGLLLLAGGGGGGVFAGLGPVLSMAAGAKDSPEGDLDAWASGHVAGVKDEAATRQETAAPKRGAGWIDPEARDARNRRRTRAAEGTRGEVDKELADARQDGVTADEVADIKARKELEARIEMTHGLELTANADEQSPDARWTLDELKQIEAALAVIPSTHLRKVERVNRSKKATRSGGMYASDDKDRTLHMYDAAALQGGSDAKRSDKITGRERRSGRYQSSSSMTGVGDVFQHEVGHAVAEDMPETFKKFSDAAGWKRVGEAGLKDLPDAERDALKTARGHKDGKDHDHSHDHKAKDAVSAGGKRYSVDPYSNGYNVRDEGSVPTGDGWQYAAAAPEEHFAEVYAKAIQVPETLHADMITGPQAQLTAANAAVSEATQAMRAAASPYDRAAHTAAAERLQAATAQRDAAQAMVTSRQKQWTIMREEVFGVTDARVATEAANLRRAGADDDAVKAFEAQASKAMTPHQLRTLAARYTPSG